MMNVERITYPVAGAIMTGALGYGLTTAFFHEDPQAEYVAAVEECQDVLEDVPQQMTELPAECTRFKEYFAYNYDTDNYYVPAASEVDSFIAVPYSDEDEEAALKLKGAFTILFASVGAWGGNDFRRNRDFQRELAAQRSDSQAHDGEASV